MFVYGRWRHLAPGDADRCRAEQSLPAPSVPPNASIASGPGTPTSSCSRRQPGGRFDPSVAPCRNEPFRDVKMAPIAGAGASASRRRQSLRPGRPGDSRVRESERATWVAGRRRSRSASGHRCEVCCSAAVGAGVLGRRVLAAAEAPESLGRRGRCVWPVGEPGGNVVETVCQRTHDNFQCIRSRRPANLPSSRGVERQERGGETSSEGERRGAAPTRLQTAKGYM